MKKIFLISGLITSLLASANIPNEGNEIMNLDSVFESNFHDLLKTMTGKGKQDKKKDKERKPSHSEVEEDRNTGRSSLRPPLAPAPPQIEPVMRAHDLNSGSRHNSRHPSQEEGGTVTATKYDDGVITVEGPIRRKPLFYPYKKEDS